MTDISNLSLSGFVKTGLRMWSVLERDPWAAEKNVCSFMGWTALQTPA